MNEKFISPSDHQRLVRAFISSTFVDMHAERECLVKFIFPELRRRCRQRRVEFTEVDLRWGITEEQKAEGRVLPICLAEIESCRPFFLGILGERYGWVPEKLDEELIKDHPWLSEHKGDSVTALEIIHGVLNNPQMEASSFFYFRAPEMSWKIEKGLTKSAGYMPEPEASHLKMRFLKEKIKKMGYPWRENYPNAEILGKLVLEDLWKAIDERYPAEHVPSPLEQERSEHEAFAAAKRKVYIGRKEYFRRLDEQAENGEPPLIVLGSSGSGKSALLANWIQEYRERHPDSFVISHFIGSTPESANYAHLLQRIMEEIKSRYNEEDEIPQDPLKAAELFPLWLAKAGSRGRLILLLDALNQLDDLDHAPDLFWLPHFFPPGVRVILSALPGRSLDALNKRGWNSFAVQPLNPDEKKKLTEEYLTRFRKSLSQEQIGRISRAEQTSNPLYLKALLDELRVFGYHARLEERIGHYLAAKTVPALYEKILERYEEDYECERPGLVGEALSLIWASRRGLAEREILDLLGADRRSMPQAFWSPLFLALGESLTSKAGLLGFFHDFLRQAVEGRYLPDSETKRLVRLRLADCFDSRDLDERKADEFPWQLCQAQSWTRLKDCLVNPSIFLLLNSERKRYELYEYWLHLKDKFNLIEACTDSINLYEKSGPSSSDLARYLDTLVLFLNLNEKYEFSERLNRRSLAIREKDLGPEHPETASSLNNLAEVLYIKNDLEGAGSLFRRALAIREKTLGPDHPMTARSLNNLGGLLKEAGHLTMAEHCYVEALAIRKRTLGEEHPETAKSLNNLALLYNNMENYELADSLLRKAIAIREKTLGPDHPFTATALANLGQVRIKVRDYKGAETCFRSALAITGKGLGEEHGHYLEMLTNLAELLRFIKDYKNAEPLYRKALATTERLYGPVHLKTAAAINKLAVLLDFKSEHGEAEPLYLKALSVREKIQGLGHVDHIQILCQLADHYIDLKDYEKAESYAGRARMISQQALGADHPQTASCHKLITWIRQQADNRNRPK